MRRTAVLSALALGAGSLALTVTHGPPASADERTVERPTAIAIPDGGSAAPAGLAVHGLGGLITDVDVRLENVEHTYPDDLDIVLLSPSGTFVMLMSDACGSEDIANRDWNFDDEAPAGLSDDTITGCQSIDVKPTNFAPDALTGPPGEVGAIIEPTLSSFDGESANGTWLLYAYDDDAGGVGQIAQGFSLSITTAPAAIVIPQATNGPGGPATPYPFPIQVGGTSGRITDVDVRLNGVYHRHPDDLDILLVSPSGKATVLMSDACGGDDIEGFSWIFDDEAPGTMTDLSLDGCLETRVKPTNFAADSDFPAPAPAGPYTAALSAFDGENPNGTWRLYARDDDNGDSGFIISPPQLLLTLDAPPETTVLKAPKKKTTQRKATIRFTSNEAGVRYQCKVDKKAWKACTSPLKLKRLKPGKHVVLIRATDSAGNVDATPAKVKWKVKR